MLEIPEQIALVDLKTALRVGYEVSAIAPEVGQYKINV